MEEKAQIQGAQTTRILNVFLLERCQLFAQEASERGGFRGLASFTPHLDNFLT